MYEEYQEEGESYYTIYHTMWKDYWMGDTLIEKNIVDVLIEI
jgi:hypothetical protein